MSRPDICISSKWYTRGRVLNIEATTHWRGREFGLRAEVHHTQDPMAACDKLQSMLLNAISSYEENRDWWEKPLGMTQ